VKSYLKRHREIFEGGKKREKRLDGRHRAIKTHQERFQTGENTRRKKKKKEKKRLPSS